MKTDLFYFSGTGNSLAVARDLAEKLGGARLRPISAALESGAVSDAARIGLIFPVYYLGPPKLVMDFIDALTIAKDAYVFAVCTCGGTPGAVLSQTQSRLASRGLALDAGFVVQMPGNYIVKYSAFPAAIQRRMLRKGQRKVEAIARLVADGRKVKVKKGILDKLGGRIYARFLARMPAMDRNYRVDERCTRCRLCVRVCPVRNIAMSDRGPEWRGGCQMCLACLQWCPAEAIQFGGKTRKRRRYHHPGITAEELIKARQGE